MKKMLALLLCVLMILPMAVSCGNDADADELEQKIKAGAVIPVYLSTPVYNFDPAYAYNDDAAVQILSLLYEGLTSIDQNGKIQSGLAEDWEIFEDAENSEYAIEFTLRKTAWSDGKPVDSNDIVYSWLRLLDPTFTSEAASLLFEIRNAKAYKNCEISSEFDVGILAQGPKLLRVEFDHPIDYDTFLRNCASLALAPVYEDNAITHKEWASNPTLVNTCGPFFVRSHKVGESLVLERNRFYRRDDERDDLDDVVTPKTLEIDMKTDMAGQLELFENGSIFFLGYIPLSQRAAYADKAEVHDTKTTHTYYFNTTKGPFRSAAFRTALSKAISREEIAKRLVFAKAAEGFVPGGIFNTARKTDFRSEGKALLADNQVAEAKAAIDMLLADKTIAKADLTFTITVRQGNEVDLAVAQYVSEVWNSMGLHVSIRELGTVKIPASSATKEYELIRDKYRDALYAGDYDVLALDVTAMTPDPISLLAPYAREYSGTAVSDITAEIYEAAHLTGFVNAEYDGLIATAASNSDPAGKALLLHQAEELLAREMPAMPLFVYQSAVLISDQIRKVDFDFYGCYVLTKMKLKNYEKYLETEK